MGQARTNVSEVEQSAASVQPEAPAPADVQEPAAATHPAHEREGFAGASQSLAATIAIAVFVITFIIQAFQIPSESMEDTLLVGDYLLVDKTHYGPSNGWSYFMPYRAIRRGDIIVFKYPVHPSQHFVKRVIGLPGDRVRLQRKRLFVNGKLQEESYVVDSLPPDTYRDNFPNGPRASLGVEASWYQQLEKLIEDGELIVPEGYIFVLGDNRDRSYDSRYWGFVPRENVIGRPLVIYLSLDMPEKEDIAGVGTSDKLSRFTYVVTHVFQNIRWKRTMRIVQ